MKRSNYKKFMISVLVLVGLVLIILVLYHFYGADIQKGFDKAAEDYGFMVKKK